MVWGAVQTLVQTWGGAFGDTLPLMGPYDADKVQEI